MPEKPLIFCTELIPRLLDGSKTMTRRVNRKFKKGDMIWVKEGWCICDAKLHMSGGDICYKANGESNQPICTTIRRWQSPRFMKKEHARIWLEVLEDSWRERLQDISGVDAVAEGCGYGISLAELLHYGGYKKARLEFFNLWDRLKGKKYPWESNPWVWVTKFRRIK